MPTNFITNTTYLTNFITETNSITSWSDPSLWVSIAIPIVLSIWALYSEYKKSKREELRLQIDKEDQQRKEELAMLKDTINSRILPIVDVIQNRDNKSIEDMQNIISDSQKEITYLAILPLNFYEKKITCIKSRIDKWYYVYTSNEAQLSMIILDIETTLLFLFRMLVNESFYNFIMSDNSIEKLITSKNTNKDK